MTSKKNSSSRVVTPKNRKLSQSMPTLLISLANGNHLGGLSLLMRNQTALLFLLSKSPMFDYPMPMPMKLEGIRCQRHICWWGSNARYHYENRSICRRRGRR